MKPFSPSRKILLIGWDAADWNVINPLLDAGQMPRLESLVNAGVMGNLSTLYPELSPMLWTSIATGKRAWKHGIYGFTEPTPDQTGIRPITSLSRKTKAIWNILSQAGIKSNVVGWWPSHPAEPINGVMVSNQYQRAHFSIDRPWPMRPGSVHPKRLETNLAELRWHPQSLVAGHILPFVPNAQRVDQDKDRRLETIARIICDCSTIQAATLAIMHHESWDFTAVYFDAIDHFSHGFMRFHPPRLGWVMKDDYEIYQQVVRSGYVYHDMMLGRLLDEAGEGTTVMIVSDHGFHSDHRRPRQIPNEPAGPAAEHRHHGIFVVKGPGIRQDQIIHGAGLLDISPTLLTLFGLPVGDDMDGRTLVEIFDTPPDMSAIPSWDAVPGDAGLHPSGVQMGAAENQALLNQLVELGYIGKPDGTVEKAVNNCIRELEYNLARTFVDADRHAAAIPVLEKLYTQWPNEFRFGLQLAHCLQAVSRLSDARTVLETVLASKKSLAAEALKELKALQATHKGKQISDLTETEQNQLRELRTQATVSDASMAYLMGCLLHAENKLAEALDSFRRAELRGFRRPQLYIERGTILLQMKQLNQAARSFETASEIDPDNPQALLGLANVFLAAKKNHDAVQRALAAIGLEYYFPMAHYVLGVGLHRLGHLSEAVTALEVAVHQNPNFVLAYQRLAYIHKHRLNQAKQADDYRQKARQARKRIQTLKTLGPDDLPDNDTILAKHSAPAREISAEPGTIETFTAEGPLVLSDTVVVVSGLPRSGTSLMMQMLKAGGLSLTTDGVRTLDDSNPMGYHEDERVKGLAADNAWLSDAKGSAVKIIAPLLKHLKPGLNYRIVFMERSTQEIVRSQSRMLEKNGRQPSDLPANRMESLFNKQASRIKKDLTTQGVPVLSVNYRECILEPSVSAKRVNLFLGGGLDSSAMADAVRPELYRERCP